MTTAHADLSTLRTHAADIRRSHHALAEAAELLQSHGIYDHLPHVGTLLDNMRDAATFLARQMTSLGAHEDAAATAEGWNTADGRFPSCADADCVRCGGDAPSNDLFCLPRVWINAVTRLPLRPDGTLIEPGEPGTIYAPMCAGCANTTATMLAVATAEHIMSQLWPRADWTAVYNPPREKHETGYPTSPDL